MRNSIIVNADDFGIDLHRDRGIVEAFTIGAISRASLLVNGRSTCESLPRALDANLPLCLHLDLTETRSLLPKEEITTLVDESGQKLGKFGLREKLDLEFIDDGDVRREAISQIECYKELLGHYPSHIDGHQHIHAESKLAQILAPLFFEYRIKTTRIPWCKNVEGPFYKRVVKEALASADIYSGNNIQSTSGFMGLETMGKNMNLEIIQRLLAEHRESETLEFMVHPGYVGEGIDDFNESPEREIELKTLIQAKRLSLYESYHFEIA